MASIIELEIHRKLSSSFFDPARAPKAPPPSSTPPPSACSTSYVDISDLDYAEELYHRTVVHGGPTPPPRRHRRLPPPGKTPGQNPVPLLPPPPFPLLPPSSLLSPLHPPLPPPSGVTGPLFGPGGQPPSVRPAVPAGLASSFGAHRRAREEMSAGVGSRWSGEPGAGGGGFGDPVENFTQGEEGPARGGVQREDWHVLAGQRVSGGGGIPVAEEGSEGRGGARGAVKRAPGSRGGGTGTGGFL
ncbi:proline-rich protein 12-like [Salvia hispanica]|uniref:proline-rich protein 12-like n=1 Tax=Salvia hispanica TaxID=49212 RepID=UPI002009C113|nr:proline-rich protein 12-like [Salvia hispanica]